MTIEEVIATFPKVFRLRNHKGEYTINRRASYASPLGSENYMLYLYTSEGLAFCKGTASELRSQIL